MDTDAKYKAIGVSLAVASGIFIGTSFVLKKKGLLGANEMHGKEAGEGYGYLKNALWWAGMTLMILGEICNSVAYAFTSAILVTSLGALSVVITAVLSSIFLKERLSFVGKVSCFLCLLGSSVIVINAPSQTSARTIQDMKAYVVHPGFLTYAGIVIVGSVCVIMFVAPKYGKKNMLVYLSICSFIGGLSVVATQGLGAAVVTQAGGTPQFNQWFLYVLLVFVACTLVTEIVYLNKALSLFNTALVTPTYYVFFTTTTIITSAILFRGFNGTPAAIADVVVGFLVICSGVVLLQLSKSAKNVKETDILASRLDDIGEAADMTEPDFEPKADAIRGALSLRKLSFIRHSPDTLQQREQVEILRRESMSQAPANKTRVVSFTSTRETAQTQRKEYVSELGHENNGASLGMQDLSPRTSLKDAPRSPVVHFENPIHYANSSGSALHRLSASRMDTSARGDSSNGKRVFSFHNVFQPRATRYRAASEEERLGLVEGDVPAMRAPSPGSPETLSAQHIEHEEEDFSAILRRLD